MVEKYSSTEQELEPLLNALAQANEKAANALLVTSHQAVAGMLVNALLIREMRRAGLVNVDVLRAEAIKRAEPLGDCVISVIEGIFGDDSPRMPDIREYSSLRIIPGGLGNT